MRTSRLDSNSFPQQLIYSNLQKCCQFLITHPGDVDQGVLVDLGGGGEVVHHGGVN